MSKLLRQILDRAEVLPFAVKRQQHIDHIQQVRQHQGSASFRLHELHQ